MVELWQTAYLPLAEDLLDHGLRRMEEQIASASRANYMRWFSEAMDISADQILKYLSARVDFLNEAWLAGTVYDTVQIEPYPESKFLSYSVRDGEPVSPPENDLVFVENPVWYDRDTGMDYDFTQPVYKDMVLLLRNTSPSPGLLYRLVHSTRIRIAVLCCLPMALALAVLAWPDFCLWWKRRRRR